MRMSKRHIAELINSATSFAIVKSEESAVFLCYEKNPLECHRSIIVNELVKRGYIDT